jgi:TonB dependent receptor/Carboxypeptidase regulatory-like domain
MRIGLTLSLLALVCPLITVCQQATGAGSVSGTIRDNYGEGLPDATVILTNPSLGLQRSMITTDEGVFYASALIPSTGYRLHVIRKGFGDWQSDDFQVSVGETLNFKIDMQVEAPAAHVDARTALPAVNNTKAGIATWISPEQVSELPTADRRLDALVLLAPAVNSNNSSGALAFQGVRSLNAFLTDGIDTTNRYYGTRAGLASQLSEDAVQELQVLPANSLSEFGHAMGGIVNAVTRTGANSYHGTGYGYFRIPSLTAAGRYALGQNLLGKENQEGGSVGGPIRQSKIFFFANLEVLNDHFDGLNRITSPLIADATGTRVPSSNCTATAAQCAAAIKFLQSQMNVTTPFSDRWISGLGKIDYRRSDRNTFSFEANAMNSRAPAGAQFGDVAANGGLLGLNDSTEQTRYGRFAWMATPNPKSVNELRLGLFQDRWFDPAAQSSLATGTVAISVAGASVGDPHNYSSLLTEHRYQLVDNFTFTAGSHMVRFGGDLSRSWDWLDQLTNSGGTYTYPSLTNFAQDLSGGGLRSYTGYTQQFGNSVRELPVKEFNLYLQDTWRATPRLLVTGGVRWEKPHYPQPVVNDATFFQSYAIPSPDINFAPRVSAAYTLDDRTVVRGGYGWFYAPLPGQLIDALFQGDGESIQSITVNPNQVGAPVFPNRIVSASAIPSGTQNLMSATAKLRSPRTQQASIAIERCLDRETTLTVSLLNSRGLKFWSATDTNLAMPSKTVTYPIDNASGQVVGSYSTQIYTAKNDGTKAHVYEIGNAGSSTYNALALELRRRMSHGVTVQASYTWSHAIDDLSGPTIAGFVPLNTYDNVQQSDKGNSAIDQRHRAVINGIWQPKVTRSDAPAARYLLNGWSLSAIATLASSEPATPVVLLNGQQFSTSTMLYTSSLNGSGELARAPFAAVNSLHTQPSYDVDLRITRTLPFTERIKGLLMFEAFNVFNTQRDTAVNTIGWYAFAAPPAGTVNGPFSGSLRPVAGLGAGIASQGFPDGTTARRCQVAFRLVF